MASCPDIQGEDALNRALDDFFSREDPLEKEIYEKLKHELLDLAKEDQLRNLPRLVFGMIKPAAYARGLAPRVVEWLRLNGFRIALAKFGEIKGKELDELYLFVKRKYQESWWIMERAYSMAPALAMVLVGDYKGHEHACAMLRKLIGPTTPEAGSRGNLRYDLKGVNRVFNIIHISDDPAAALRESSVFFDMEEVLESLSSNNEVKLHMERLKPSKLRELSRWKTFSDLKRRCVNLLNSNELQELLNEESNVLSEDLPFDEERRKLLPIEVKISRIAQSIWRKVREDAINKARTRASLEDKRMWDVFNDRLFAARCIELLSDELKLLEERDFDLLMLWMINRGIIADEWEEIIAHSTWAVMPQMVRDFRKYGKIIISGKC